MSGCTELFVKLQNLSIDKFEIQTALSHYSILNRNLIKCESFIGVVCAPHD
jgi:hypothetical protein